MTLTKQGTSEALEGFGLFLRLKIKSTSGIGASLQALIVR
jgi:hypothetical protein